MGDVAKLFQTGGSQAVRLPADYRFSCHEVAVRRDKRTGDVVLSARIPQLTWAEFVRLRAAASGELDGFLTERFQASEPRDPFAKQTKK
jgi:antitoxin VapB